MTADVIELFPATADPLVGRAIAMAEACGCGSNIVLISAGKGPHAAELRCRNCDRHRQWLSHEDYKLCGTVIAEITNYIGAPAEISFPVIQQRRRQAMTEYDNTNKGVLFKNEDKQNQKHADYKGNINVNGEEFWLNAWLKTSQKGTR